MAKPRPKCLVCVSILIWISLCSATAEDWKLTKRISPVPAQLNTVETADLIDTFSEAFVVQFDDEGELVDLPSWVKKRRYDFDLKNSASPPTYASLDEATESSQFEVARSAIATVRESTYSLNLIFFVHGWKHNSKRESHPKNVSNLESFEKLLRVLNEHSLTKATKNGQRSIYMGVYIGWRGSPWPTLRSLPTYHPVRLLNWLPVNLTFWNRLRAADRVSRASLSYVLLSLNAEAKQLSYPNNETTGEKPNHTIIIGHSMGARIVEQTLGQVMVADIANSALELRLAEEQKAPSKPDPNTRSVPPSLIESIENAIAIYERTLRNWQQTTATSPEQLVHDANALSEIEISLPQTHPGSQDPSLTEANSFSAQIYDTFSDSNANLTQLHDAALELSSNPNSDVSDFQLQQIYEQLRTHCATQILLLKSIKLHLLTQETQAHPTPPSEGLLSKSTTQPRIDLVFLINPANGSIISRQITEAFSDPHLSEALENRKVDGNDIPWIISVSSTSDFATAKTYGATSAALWSMRKYRKGQDRDQFRYFKKPAPHNDQFRNLELRKKVDREMLSIPGDLQKLISLNFNENVLSEWLQTNEIPNLQNAIVTPEGAYQLSKVEGVQSHPSYWAVLCHDGIIEGHHDIFKQKTIALIAGFLRLSKRFNAETPPSSNDADDILDSLQ